MPYVVLSVTEGQAREIRHNDRDRQPQAILTHAMPTDGIAIVDIIDEYQPFICRCDTPCCDD